MVLLQFSTTLSLSTDQKSAFADRVTELYASEMATPADRVAVTIDTGAPADLHLGRAVEGPLLFLDADVRRGQSSERKRAFALAVAEYAGDEFAVPDENVMAVFTEHAGEELVGVDRVGDGREADEA